jgi:hypothetical protein
MLSDTSPDAEKVQVELLRKAGFAGRFARMEALTAMAINLSRRAIAEANPGLSPRELEVKCVELFYGSRLAQEFRASLNSR